MADLAIRQCWGSQIVPQTFQQHRVPKDSAHDRFVMLGYRVRDHLHLDFGGQMTFRVGQKVVCIAEADADSPHFDPRAIYPDLSTVYTVRSIFERGPWSCLTLVEISNSHIAREGFERKYFRPVVERKTDISVFRRMLLPSGVDA